MTAGELKDILENTGKTKVFEKDYKHFNAGNTEFKNHKEYLFVTKVLKNENSLIFIGQRARFANQNLGWIKFGEEIENIKNTITNTSV